MELNDPLKAKAFGTKKDYLDKQDHIRELLENNKRYYPPDMGGVIDEWGAMARHQAQLHELAEHNRRISKK